MKPIQIALAPTRSRPLNMFLGVVLALISVFFLSFNEKNNTANP
jgi:S-DNA-T family DNA segregation ATPase FtsK/SpoIIIE